MARLAERNPAAAMRPALIAPPVTVPAAMRHAKIAVAAIASAQTPPAQQIAAAATRHAKVAALATVVTFFAMKRRAAATALAVMEHAQGAHVALVRATMPRVTIAAEAIASAPPRPVAVIVSAAMLRVQQKIRAENPRAALNPATRHAQIVHARIDRGPTPRAAVIAPALMDRAAMAYRRIAHAVIPRAAPTASVRMLRARRAARKSPAVIIRAMIGPAPRRAATIRRMAKTPAASVCLNRRRAKPHRASHWRSLPMIPRISSTMMSPSAPPNCWPAPVLVRAAMSNA